MNTFTSLQQIGKHYETDKSGITGTHFFNNRSFLDIYERYFKFFKNQKINFLELGILNGGSIKTWETYFTNANIVALDIDPSKKHFESDRTKIYIGSQSDKSLLNQIKIDYPSKFAVILDDASHLNDLTIKSFELLFEHVMPGGLYIIEDTHCTYGSSTFETDVKKWPGMKYNDANTNYKNTRQSFLEFIIPKITDLDHKQGNIFSLHFYSETLIIEKTR